MKKTVLIFCFFGNAFLWANGPEKIQWYSYSEALRIAQKEPRMIWVFLYASWCLPCRIMENDALLDTAVIRLLNSKFYAVKLDVESQEKISCDHQNKTVERCFSDVWELKGTPSFVLVAPKGLSILTFSRLISSKDLSFLLESFLESEKEWLQ